MSILTTVYTALSSDALLVSLLGSSTTVPSKPAIYEAWAGEDTPRPYICLTYFSDESNHWAKRDTTTNVDIFTDGDTVQAETIRNRVIEILDRQELMDAEDREVRLYLNNDSIIDEDNERICHWNVEFTALIWRNKFVDYLISEYP